MAVLEDRSMVSVQSPPLSPARRAGWTRRTKEQFRTGLQDWAGQLLLRRRLVLLSLVLLIAAVFIDYCCGTYVSFAKGVQAPDLILDHLEPVDMGFLFVYGYAALVLVMFLYPLVFRVRILHVVAIQFSLLLMLRSFFMLFTHLETPASSVPVAFPWVFQGLYFENDMFFSGHVAMPFLGFYLFGRSPLRYVFLTGAVVMGFVVLAMHLHYSIDVFAAYFLTYCSYRMGHAVIQRLDRTYVE